MKHYLLLLSLVFIVSACVDIPSDVSIPQWDTELNLPLMDRNYTLEDLINTDEYISIDSIDSDYLYLAHYDKVADPQGITDFLEGRLDQSESDIPLPITTGEGTIGIAYKNGLAIDTAFFVSGTLSITVNNNSAGPLDFTMILPAFIKGGKKLTFTSQIPGNQKLDFSEDLEGYTYSVSRQKYSADSLQIDGSIAGSDITNTFSLDYQIENTMFEYLAGIVPPTVIDPVSARNGLPVTEDVEKFKDIMKFYDATLTITGNYVDFLEQNDPYSSFKIRIGDFRIRAFSKNSSKDIFLKLKSNPNNENLGPIDVVDGKLKVVYTTDNSNLSDVLSFLPDSIAVIAIPTVNPDGDKGAATNKDYIQFGFDIVIRSAVSISDYPVTDTLEFSMDDDARKNIRDFKAATIYFEIDNRVAFGGNLKVHFLDTTKISNAKKLFTIDSVEFDPADLTGEGMPVLKHSSPTIELDSTQVQYLSNSNQIIMDVIINTTDAHTKAVFTSKDWLDVKSFCKVKYHVNLDDNSDSTNTK